MMDLPTAIAAVAEGRDLTDAEMTAVMRRIMCGDATDAQIGGFLVGLKAKSETVEEIAAAASVMRDLALTVTVDGRNLVDTCGTGGDGKSLFNVSTAAAFVVAAAGGRVAKHGNRSLSSRSGSADVLEAAGVGIELPPERVARCIEDVGMGFLYAPLHHGVTRHAARPRRELAIRTIFNLLGPLTNPARAPRQLVGVYAPQWVEPLARVLEQLGSEHVLVVHSEDGFDEISLAAPTQVAELKDGEVRTYNVSPEDFGVEPACLHGLTVTGPQESLALIRRIFAGEPGPAQDLVVVNAAAAIYVAGLAADLPAAAEMARAAIVNGEAGRRLAALVEATR
jgi:anthranilate phosphoribosyltransferase